MKDYLKTLESIIKDYSIDKVKLAIELNAKPDMSLPDLEYSSERAILRYKPKDKAFQITYDLSWVAEILDDDFYTLLSSGDRESKLEALLLLLIKLKPDLKFH